MKKPAAAFGCFAFGLFFATRLLAQPVASRVIPADRAWMDLQMPMPAMQPSQEAASDPAARNTALATRAAGFVARANQAKAFYSQYPQHGKAGEAKLAEVCALVSATQAGDATVEGRMASLVQILRSDSSVSPAIRVQAASAYEFSRQMRGAGNHEERLQAIERVARDLTVEFPQQPQGYEALLTVAAASSDEMKAKKIARELLAMSAPLAVKDGAQKLLGRFDLVGKPLGAELDGANAIAARSAVSVARPTIVYSWATWSPGSLALADELKNRGLAANIISLNLDTDTVAAAAVARREGLIGTLIYDGRGREGALAQRLKIRGASQVLLVDAQGIIRDVRGEDDLKNKLRQSGL